MGYRLSFLMEHIFTNKKIRTNYLIRNQNFAILAFMLSLIFLRYLLAKKINDIKTDISKENKNLRSLRQLL